MFVMLHFSFINNNFYNTTTMQAKRPKRIKERYVGEAHELVSRWRQLYASRTDGKRLTLDQAAELVGVPRKTLEDYHYQLKRASEVS